MGQVTEIGRRIGTVRPELQSIVEGVDFVPKRVSRTETSVARKFLEGDGAVILTGWPGEPDSVVNAAAAVLGTRLREFEKIQARTTNSAEALTLHRDGAHVVIDVNDRLVRLRIADPDYALILCTVPAPTGGESVVVDGYRLLDRLRVGAPELYEFVTSVDVDVTSRITYPDVYRVPRVCRMVEWTRGGRMILRIAEYAQPVPRETQWEEHERLIAAYADVITTAAARARCDTTLAAGEVLILDNYRCLHGVRAHEGHRTLHVLRCKSQDAL
ncbi:MAG: TauD/TfdA family dioxygenase [Pseudonocardiaceae bacterium]